MKKLLLLFAALLTLTLADAQRISEQQAFQKAQKFLQDKQVIGQDNARKMNRAPQQPSNQAYYIFNIEQQGGFVIVAGDERMPEVLGYSTSGSIDMDNVPCGLKWLLGCYEQMAKNVENSDDRPAKSRAMSAKAPVAPFVSTTWGQSTPYNAMCPKVDGARCVTGCVATAMAQIMNYYRWPNEVTTPIPAYTTYTNKVSMPELEPTTFTWGHLNKNQLSKLMLYCGQAVQMDYGPEESGAGVPDEALRNYFGYDESLRLVIREGYSDAEWDNMLYEDLAAQKPIYYFGYDAVSGHAFVLCGFQDDHYYINWGWDGAADGYFILDGISPAVGAYNNGQGAVIGIKPKGTPTSVTCYPRRIVVENNAHTGMGESVMGEEAVKRLTADYPDDFIGIQTYSYNYDLNGAENYTYMMQKYGCYPSCYINRSIEISPYYNDIKKYVELLKNCAYADVSATAIYAKPDKSAITVTAESTFGFNSSDEDFRLAFVILEDNVGPYTQDNSFYSNPSAPDDPDDWLNEWRHKGPQVEMMLNNVARGIYGDAQGIEGSLPNTIEKGEIYRYEYSFSLPTPQWDGITYNKDNFRVVALLIDKSTGEIMNACQTKIDYDTSVENLKFEFENSGKRLANSETVVWKSEGMSGDNLEMDTNQKTDGLKLCTFDGHQVSGTAKLEILTNTLGAPVISWGMGNEPETVTDNTKEISFTTNTNGTANVQLKASGISQFGVLEARITATVNGTSQSVVVKFVHRQTDGVIGENIQLGNGEAWWNNTSSYTEWRQGTDKEERYHAATHIPANLFGDKVPTIDGIGFWGTTSGMANVTLWISSHLPAAGEQPDIACFSFPDDEMILEKWNYMAFHQHYQIPEEGVYVGYSFDIVDMNTYRSGKPVLFGEKTRDNALWFKTESMPEWIDRFDDTQGNLSLQILFGGNVQKKNAVKITNVEPTYSLTNSETKLHFQITNEGSEPLSYIEYDGDFGHHRMDIYLPPYASSNPEYFPGLDVKVGNEAIYTEKLLTISKVNGEPNESEEGSVMIPLYVSRKESPSVAVLEEFTATWCGWSPAATLEIETYNKNFGEQLITICAHGSSTEAIDPMELPEYSEIRSLSGGKFPTCVINRGLSPIDRAWDIGFANDMNIPIEKALAEKVPGSVEVCAAWDDETQNGIKIQTRTTFELNATELPFQIGYVLLEDSLCGEGIEWAQQNIYSGIEDVYDSRLEELTQLPPLIYGQKYNHVPVAAWDAYKGIEGSLVGPFNAGMPVYSSFDASIENNTLIQNKENLTLVALLVNKETGKIINAAKCQIQPYGTDISVVEVKANNYTRKYGEANPVFEYTTSGGELIGTPVITCEATETSPVGEYPIIVTQGTVENFYVSYIAGTLTIEAAPLTISAGEYTKRQYEPMPEFMLSYSGFKNNETSAVLTTQPVVTCDATEDSEPGVYPVTVSGAEAQNYDISYINGTLTVTEPASYTLTYLVDGEVYKTLTLKQNETITPEPEPEKEGYTFSGWSEIPEVMPAHDVTVTGTFSINSYKLTYIVDGEEYKVYELEYGAAITPEAEPEQEGYTFSGWSEIPATMPAHDVTVTGTFTINTYKLTYIVDGEEYKTYEVEYGTAITAEPAPEKEGYTFSGWSEIPETMPAHDVTVTGTFSINTYKLTYMIDDKVYKEVMYEYGATITPEPQPEGDYARFEWIGVPETMPANDVTVYASYETGIIDLLTLQGVKAIYAPNGKKLDKPQKGLNIVVMNDGTVRRVVLK